MKIGLDTVPLIYSRGADYRTTFNLYQELLQDRDYDYSMLSISRDKQSPVDGMFANHLQSVIHHWRAPFSLFDWGWTYLGWPTIEWMMGDVDLFHATSIYAPPAKQAKVMITVRGIVAEVIPEKLPANRVKALHKVLCKGLDGAAYYSAVSQATADDLEHVMGIDPARIHVIPHGVDPIFRPPVEKELLAASLKTRFNLQRPYILFVGAIGIHKNVMGVFHAWLKLHQQADGNLDLCLVGRPDSAWDQLRQQIESHGVSDYVHLMGWVDPHSQDLVDIYGGAECFVLPSYYEGWCSPPVEAMACGTPAVVSNVSSLPETTGGAALLINPDEVDEIAQGIARVLYEPPLRERLTKAGLAHATAMNWARSAQAARNAYAAIFKEVADA